MRYFPSAIVGLVMVGLLVIPQVAMADLGEVLGEIEWGDDQDEVLEQLREAELEELRGDRELRNDRAAMQRARQQVLDQMRRVEDSHTPLEGERTDYDVSVVSGEFTRDNGESLMRIRDRHAQRFFFFLDDEFYKLVVAYDPDHIDGVGFPGVVNETQQEYGEPTSMTPGARAVWRDRDIEMRVDDRRDYFGTFTMTFVDRQRVEQLEGQGEVFGGRHDADDDDGVSERVESITGPSDGSENESVVDSIVGDGPEDVEFSSDDDEPEEEEPEHRAESTSSDSESSSASSDSDTDEPDPAPQPQAEPDEDEEDDDDDDDGLMIY